MSHLESDAIILRTWEFGESDLFVSFLTEKSGRLKGVAKGARRSRKRFANCLELFCLVRLEYETKKNGRPCFLHSCRLLEPFSGLRNDFSALSLASYMVELAEVLFPENMAEPEALPLMLRMFRGLSDGLPQAPVRAAFEAGAMSLGGFGIRFDACCDCRRVYKNEGRAVFDPSKGGIVCLGCQTESESKPGLSPSGARTLQRMVNGDWDLREAEGLDGAMVEEIGNVLRLHIEYRIGKSFKSARYLD